MNEVAKKYNVSCATVTYVMKRCLESDTNAPPSLTKGLIPNTYLNQQPRQKELSEFDDNIGARGSFKLLIADVEGLKDHLDLLLKNHINKVSYGENLTPKSFHKYFLSYLKSRSWPQYKYPFNTSSKGSETLRKYFYLRIRELKLKTPKVHDCDMPVIDIAPFYDLELDAQMTDVETSLCIEHRGQVIPLRVSRVTLYLLRDKASTCNVAHHISFSKHPNRFDLLRLLTNVHKKWQPMELTTPGLEYPTGNYMPSQLDDIFLSIGLGNIKLDNALAHWAHLIQEYLCVDLNCMMNWGHPGSPKERNFVEHAFALLNEYIHRFNSTTGSHSQDPKKEPRKNKKKVPVLTLRALKEVISILIATDNVTPKKHLGSKSPIEFLEGSLMKHPLWIHNDSINKNKDPFIFSEKVFVRCDEKNNQSPHVYFLTLKYKGPCIIRPELINQQIIATYDSRDVRKIKVSTLTGEPLGVLNAAKSWQLCPLDLDTLKDINKLTKEKRLNMKDPVAGYFQYLLEHKDLPSVALKLFKLSEIMEIEESEVQKIEDPLTEVQTQLFESPDEDIDIPEWTPEMMYADESDGDE